MSTSVMPVVTRPKREVLHAADAHGWGGAIGAASSGVYAALAGEASLSLGSLLEFVTGLGRGISGWCCGRDVFAPRMAACARLHDRRSVAMIGSPHALPWIVDRHPRIKVVLLGCGIA